MNSNASEFKPRGVVHQTEKKLSGLVSTSASPSVKDSKNGLDKSTTDPSSSSSKTPKNQRRGRRRGPKEVEGTPSPSTETDLQAISTKGKNQRTISQQPIDSSGGTVGNLGAEKNSKPSVSKKRQSKRQIQKEPSTVVDSVSSVPSIPVQSGQQTSQSQQSQKKRKTPKKAKQAVQPPEQTPSQLSDQHSARDLSQSTRGGKRGRGGRGGRGRFQSIPRAVGEVDDDNMSVSSTTSTMSTLSFASTASFLSTGKTDMPLRERLELEFMRNKYQCPICMDRVSRSHKIWSCPNCYAVLHIHCMKQWMFSNLDAATKDSLPKQAKDSGSRGLIGLFCWHIDLSFCIFMCPIILFLFTLFRILSLTLISHT